ncbi:hypothetical protein VTH82DRAFT_2475 [Thermothelomyces myriococcoides]
MATILEALHPYPEERLHLRMHRARSVVLTSEELVEIRAAQRTFEGAYMRTALSQFSFALVVLKIFTSEFYPIGALLACYGAAVMLVAIYRRYEGNRQFFDSEEMMQDDDDDEEEEEEEEGREEEREEGDGGESESRSDGDGGGGRGGRDNMPGYSNRVGHKVKKSRSCRRSNGQPPRAGQIVVKKKFRTSGNSVGLLVGLSLVSYLALLVLLWELAG